MSKFSTELFVSQNDISATMGTMGTLSVKQFETYCVIIKNGGASHLDVEFAAFSHGLCATLNFSLFANQTTKIKPGETEIYQLFGRSFDQLVLKGSSPMAIAASSIQICFDGRKGN